MKKFIIVAGARPNFIKIAPLIACLKKYPSVRPILVHTGQHYDFELSRIFFRDLDIPEPDINLNIGSAPYAQQISRIKNAFEKVLLKVKPDLVIVAGDVNSTLACSMAASRLNIKLAHIEAGLRSFDLTMPEEINRRLTDGLSDYLFVSEKSGLVNLRNEGIEKEKVFFVGNIMIDALVSNMGKIDRSRIFKQIFADSGVLPYGVLTLHRPSNVDSKKALLRIVGILKMACKNIKLIYPMHPRARSMIRKFKLERVFGSIPDLCVIEPLGYADFLHLVKYAEFVMTDSGGIQEEATVLKVPCLTMRKNTERPSTVREGTNVLVGLDKGSIRSCLGKILKDKWKKSKVPALWDAKTAERICRILLKADLK
ncbi:MAG: UDP-N-acetylglucosamine 2-epimerase (non-hydrolyzing) [Candidatus Omnitrophota bacterium]